VVSSYKVIRLSIPRTACGAGRKRVFDGLPERI
jgi:hypothetical protein